MRIGDDHDSLFSIGSTTTPVKNMMRRQSGGKGREEEVEDGGEDEGLSFIRWCPYFYGRNFAG